MHSRIFQISTSPISADEYITTSDYDEHWFTKTIAEYVSDDNDRAEDIASLRSYLSKSIAYDEMLDSFIILPNGKEEYFTCAYERFIQARDETMKMGLAEFVSNDSGSAQVMTFSDLIRKMNQAFCATDSFYVSSDEFGTVTIDKFIRQSKAGIRYFIGGVLDYHI